MDLESPTNDAERDRLISELVEECECSLPSESAGILTAQHHGVIAGLGANRGGQGVHRKVESEGLAEKLRAGIDGSHPDHEPVGQEGAEVESALWRRRRYPSTPRTKVCAAGTERKTTS
jgi:hypothetical protein